MMLIKNPWGVTHPNHSTIEHDMGEDVTTALNQSYQPFHDLQDYGSFLHQ
jgi:hypothetical protein